VGDFGKLGMLRCMERLGLKVGVNWYLVNDEDHNNDGKHIGYLADKKYCGCDDELLMLLENVIKQGNRSVVELEKQNVLSSQKYFHKVINDPRSGEGISRKQWHEKGLMYMSDCDLVFLDPDNGIIPKSVGLGSKNSVKYVLPEEIMDYYKAGHSVVFYSHRTREQLPLYLERFKKLFNKAEGEGAVIRGITFKRGTIRDYFFIIQDKHLSQVEKGLDKLFQGAWRQHFEGIEILNKRM
jgi:hypothetical protein